MHLLRRPVCPLPRPLAPRQKITTEKAVSGVAGVGRGGGSLSTSNTVPRMRARARLLPPAPSAWLSPRPSTSGPGCALSPEDLAPSPFASPHVLAACVLPRELSAPATASVPPACASLTTPGSTLGAGVGRR
ncbi:hypothetical protein B0H19DRAFT_682186 [Mycena capillaripes]|nr:hypothetical protein B0H19DRAFT_682186 [Mycena capillaripes]